MRAEMAAPIARCRLRRTLDELAADLAYRATHLHDPVVQIEVAPAQEQQLAPQESGELRQEHQRPEPRPHLVGDGVDLLDGEPTRAVIGISRRSLSAKLCSM